MFHGSINSLKVTHKKPREFYSQKLKENLASLPIATKLITCSKMEVVFLVFTLVTLQPTSWTIWLQFVLTATRKRHLLLWISDFRVDK